MSANLVTAPMEGGLDTATAAPTSKLQCLGRLAAEIHIEIAKNLEKEDLRSLRCVSRSLAKDTFEVFAEKNFLKVSCRFTTPSLENVRNVSAAPQFVRFVKSIEFHAEPGYKTWATSVPRSMINGRASQLGQVRAGRARVGIDTPIKDIFSNFAKCGSAICVKLSTIEELFVPALHAVAIALNAANHAAEGLHCYTHNRTTPASDVLDRGYFRDRKSGALPDFHDATRQAWSHLRVIQINHQEPGKFWHEFGAALYSLIHGASVVQELTTQVPLGLFCEHIEDALIPTHRLKMLKLVGHGDQLSFNHLRLNAMLSKVQHSLEILMLEDITLVFGRWKHTLEWISSNMSLQHISCRNLQNVPASSTAWFVFCDRNGSSEFEIKGSEDEVKEDLSKVIAEGGYRLEHETDLSGWSSDEEPL